MVLEDFFLQSPFEINFSVKIEMWCLFIGFKDGDTTVTYLRLINLFSIYSLKLRLNQVHRRFHDYHRLTQTRQR